MLEQLRKGLVGIAADLDRIDDVLKKRLFASDEELETLEQELSNINKTSSNLCKIMLDVPRMEPFKPLERELREAIDAILGESCRINNLKARIKNAKTKPIPRSEDLDCTNAFIMRDALQRLGYYAEIADYEAPGYSRYGNYNPAPVLLTNANENELLILFPDWNDFYDDEAKQDLYISKYDPVGTYYQRYCDGWTCPVPDRNPKASVAGTMRYWFPSRAVSHDDWIRIITNQPPKYNSDDVICFYSKGDYPQFSNFHPSELSIKIYKGANVVDEEKYASVEHYFQIMKALEFDADGEALKQMGNHLTCAQIKSIGRKVQNFDAGVWNIRRRFHMLDAVAMKFYQHADLQELLLSTGDAVLAEASPRDTFWGIGYSKSNPKAFDPSQWRGKNVLGNMLMYLRESMRRYKEQT